MECYILWIRRELDTCLSVPERRRVLHNPKAYKGMYPLTCPWGSGRERRWHLARKFAEHLLCRFSVPTWQKILANKLNVAAFCSTFNPLRNRFKVFQPYINTSFFHGLVKRSEKVSNAHKSSDCVGWCTDYKNRNPKLWLFPIWHGRSLPV